jgi:hypothetical protein
MGKTGFGGFPSCSLNVEKSVLTEIRRSGNPRQPAIAGGCRCRFILLRLFYYDRLLFRQGTFFLFSIDSLLCQRAIMGFRA